MDDKAVKNVLEAEDAAAAVKDYEKRKSLKRHAKIVLDNKESLWYIMDKIEELYLEQLLASLPEHKETREHVYAMVTANRNIKAFIKNAAVIDVTPPQSDGSETADYSDNNLY